MATTLLESLHALDATVFENLAYDLLVLSGLRNVTWRTPGADGGRDIQGDAIASDFSGGVALDRWYIECKRYASSVDWPTIYKKLSYASNHEADYLLLLTTATLSPKCKDEVLLRNDRRTKPLLRCWDGPHLETLVSQQPLLLAKYALHDNAPTIGSSILPLIRVLAKVSRAAYGTLLIANSSTPSADLATALLELADEYLLRVENALHTSTRFRRSRDDYAWCSVAGNARIEVFPAAALRCVLAIVHFLCNGTHIEVRPFASDRLALRPLPPDTPATIELLQAVTMYGDVELERTVNALVVSVRT